MKAKTAKQKKDAALAEGAKKIVKAKKSKAKAEKPVEAQPLVQVEIPELTRPKEDIVRDRVQILPGSVGLKIADETPLEEVLVVLDWATQLNDHVGFMKIGRAHV